jgi:hypothetical protein
LRDPAPRTTFQPLHRLQVIAGSFDLGYPQAASRDAPARTR